MNGDPQAEELARRRFMVLGLVRFSGVALAVFGAAITARVLTFLPEEAGYIIIAAGAIDALVVPIVLGRAWKTPKP